MKCNVAFGTFIVSRVVCILSRLEKYSDYVSKTFSDSIWFFGKKIKSKFTYILDTLIHDRNLIYQILPSILQNTRESLDRTFQGFLKKEIVKSTSLHIVFFFETNI